MSRNRSFRPEKGEFSLQECRNTFLNAPIGIFSSTPEGRYLSVNPYLASMYGYDSPEDMIESVTDIATQIFIDPMDRKEFVRLLEERDKLVDYEWRVRHRDGHELWMSTNASANRDESGKITHFQGFTIDITERKRAKKALEERDALLTKLSQQVPGIIYLYQCFPDGRSCFPFASEHIRDVFEVMPEEITNDSSRIFKRVHPDDLDRFMKSIFASYENLTTWKCDFRVKLPIKGMRWIRGIANPEKQADGSVLWYGYSMDLTDRMKIEEELLRSKSQLSNALSMGKLGHWELDVAAEIFTFSDSFYEIFKTTAEEMGGYTMSMKDYSNRFIHPDDRHLVFEETRKALESDDPVFSRCLEHRMLYADGSTGHIAVQFLTVKDGSGKTIKTYGVNQDITERKRGEAERERLQAQLIVARWMESVGRLAGGVAHDFNNMLGVILGHTELALMQMKSDSPYYNDLVAIRSSAARSADLTRQLLGFARKQTIFPKVLDLNETIEGMLKTLRRLIGENIRLAWLPGKNPCKVKIDPLQVDQILANLCANAQDAIDGVGTLTLETESVTLDEAFFASHGEASPGEYVVLSVADTGRGMEPEVLENLFEPFFTTKEVGKGTGLGVPTVYGIVKQNKGFMTVQSEPGQGAVFRIYLPRHCQEAERKEGAVHDPHTSSEKKNILLVEDDPAVLSMVAKLLAHLNYTAITALTPTKAIRTAQEHARSIHLLVTDVMMPEMNGRELAQTLRALYPDMKVLFMSGYTADIIAHHGMLDSGVHFIPKPFSMKDFAAKIKEVLQQQNDAHPFKQIKTLE